MSGRTRLLDLMRRLITAILLVINIISFQFYNSIQHKRDNFTMCGNSYSENNQDEGNFDEMKFSEIRQMQIAKNVDKGFVKEIKTITSDHFFMQGIELNPTRHDSGSYFLSLKIDIADSFCPNLIFKPS